MRTDVDMPRRIARLPRNVAGYPVPWFVAFIDGQPDFRVIGPRRIEDAVQFGRCWICGQPTGAHVAFALGPMCTITRTTAEPPSHQHCAVYAAQACPFLTTPDMRRRESRMPEGSRVPAGVMVARNPGVVAVWSTHASNWSVFPDPTGDPLFNVGDPTAVRWYAEGRRATRAEVLTSIDGGMPLLRENANGPGEHAELDRMVTVAMTLIPRETA